MTPPSEYERFAAEPSSRRLLRQEELLADVAEHLQSVMRSEGLTQAEVARRLGKSRSFVCEALGGDRNLTLRTVAELADAMGQRLCIHSEDLESEVRKLRAQRQVEVLERERIRQQLEELRAVVGQVAEKSRADGYRQAMREIAKSARLLKAAGNPGDGWSDAMDTIAGHAEDCATAYGEVSDG